MTRQGAIDTGQAAAIRFGKPWIVWRMPKWPADCYGVRAVDLGLPSEAETFETLTPTPNAPEPAGQGSLFG